MKRNLYILIIVLIIIILSAIFIFKSKDDKTSDLAQEPVQKVAITQNNLPSEQCYFRTTIKTDEKPFSVEEFLRLEFNENKVKGMKFGFQSGPGYSNGYTGTLTGTRTSLELVLNYEYIVEGSSNTEQEIYKITNDGIERIQYRLIEKNNMLMPDRTTPGVSIPYESFSCVNFAEKVPK